MAVLRPATKVLFMSGYSQGVVVQQGVLDHGCNLIEKPFSTDDLLRKVREVLDGDSRRDVGTARLGRTKVLVVDDDADFRRATARTLAAHGYLCVEAASSARARAVLDSQLDVAAVLCDIRMPGQSGIDLLTEITADFPDLAVLMMTGIDDPDLAEVAFGLGAFGYLIKPFGTNELLICLAGACAAGSSRWPAGATSAALEQTVARTRLLGRVLEGLDGEPGAALDGDEEMIERLSHAVSTGEDDTAGTSSG